MPSQYSYESPSISDDTQYYRQQALLQKQYQRDQSYLPPANSQSTDSGYRNSLISNTSFAPQVDPSIPGTFPHSNALMSHNFSPNVPILTNSTVSSNSYSPNHFQNAHYPLDLGSSNNSNRYDLFFFCAFCFFPLVTFNSHFFLFSSHSFPLHVFSYE